MSEILAEHKKKLPAKYDKKGKPNNVGSDELPFPICVTPSRKGGHHFHFQHEPYSRRFVMCARNYYSCSVQLACMTRACSGRVNITPNNPNMIKCIGERQSKERKKTKIKKKYAIDWECPDTMLAENWKIIPSSVRAHCCNPQHPHKSTKDLIRSMNSADCLEKRRNMEPLFNQILGEFANAANNKNPCCPTSQKSSKWCSCLNLSSIPTKPEELHVKVDEKSRTLTVSGKSEVESTRRDGVKIFSTHVWTKEIRIPHDVELKTIASKLHENKLTFVAERVQKEEDKQHEIPIEIVDTPALD